MARIAIKMIVDAAHRAETQKVCDTLRSMGMEIETTLPEIGVIFGRAEEALLPKLACAEGIETAEPERSYRVPPPSDDVPQ